MEDPYDVLVIGGGVNGCGIARDAAGRGLSVLLAERGDLASGTSSASTKLFHGGLRYLEHREFRMVREALIERERLLGAMPHISWPLRFVLPLGGGGGRPAWVLRLGLFLYDSLGGRKILPGTTRLDLRRGPEGRILKDHLSRAYEYSDCWVDDARLVVLNARDAAARGAVICPRTTVTGARSGPDGLWEVTLEDSETGVRRSVRSRALVNAAGPAVAQVLGGPLGQATRDHVRLVRGSHIVVPRLQDHDKAYFLQGEDGRIMFILPYEDDFSLIGTTDVDHGDPDQPPVCTGIERDYMLAFVNRYLSTPLGAEDVVWSYAGVRPLHDDGAGEAARATRDYVLRLQDGAGPPLLSVFGGKITTYRRLSEQAVDLLAPQLATTGPAWTAGVALPGGDFAVSDRPALLARLKADFPFLSAAHAARLFRQYGTECWKMLEGARSEGDLGRHFGATLTEAEVRWLMDHEYARSAQDVTHRRTKLVLRMTEAQVAALDAWMQAQQPPAVVPLRAGGPAA
ncbi:glycerol-3-phosphate dehydrogenase [Pseudooceanicola sp. CBS1P-1]|uniref:Glycerol-3-phosphate dehydrogenase n=1 Tax=Pseudooceanicola albus TaxID=2692189 RepID=A0A6L7G776_9RHOB|nr:MULTISPECIES: glycerol-3-phosphate dehydrogenase [Pseudooceanicola]MBT9386187.1 glycerol-3-phosphate dehydrogenase [Pseudooceanicola endophyticus]MXN19398.1 glycerol-3-phosphate dehydrogenase [Pseudooceanicola albus]